MRLVGIEPDRHGLLQWLATRVTPEHIRAVAESDYGEKAGANAKAIQRILDHGRIPTPIDADGSWVQEVCELTKWRADTGQEHVPVALACTILILAGAPGESLRDHLHAMSDPVGGLALAMRGVDAEAKPLALGMLADACLRYGEDEHDDLFCAFGVVALRGHIDERTASFLIEWEAAAHASEADSSPGQPLAMPSWLDEYRKRTSGCRSTDWLFRVTSFDQMKSGWRELLLALDGEGAPRIRALVEQWRR